MEESHSETKSKKDKILISVIAVLALALIAQTGYLIKVKNTPAPQKAEVRHVPSYQTPVSRPQPQFHASFSSPWDQEHWDPFMEMERMQDYMNRMFRDSFRRASTLMGPDSLGHGLDSFFEPDLDIQDLKDRYVITLDIPGMEKDKLNIEVRDHYLTVSGERTSASEKRDEEQGFYSMERQVGAFKRTIPLPEDAVSTEVKASYEKGELKIEIPKRLPAPETAEPKARKIPVQ